MPFFVCDNCGIVDSTALTNYAAVLTHYCEAPTLYDDDPGAYPPPPSETLRFLCSACDPESPTHGGWHGQFPARNLSEWGYVLFKNPLGYCGKPEWETFFCSHCVMLQGGTPHQPDCCLAGIPAWSHHNHPASRRGPLSFVERQRMSAMGAQIIVDDLLDPKRIGTMTWKDFKALIEAQGIRDNDEVSWINWSGRYVPERQKAGTAWDITNGAPRWFEP